MHWDRLQKKLDGYEALEQERRVPVLVLPSLAFPLSTLVLFLEIWGWWGLRNNYPSIVGFCMVVGSALALYIYHLSSVKEDTQEDDEYKMQTQKLEDTTKITMYTPNATQLMYFYREALGGRKTSYRFEMTIVD